MNKVYQYDIEHDNDRNGISSAIEIQDTPVVSPS